MLSTTVRGVLEEASRLFSLLSESSGSTMVGTMPSGFAASKPGLFQWYHLAYEGFKVKKQIHLERERKSCQRAR